MCDSNQICVITRVQTRGLSEGQLVEGVVEELRPQGAVVRLLPDGPSAFMHITQVSREKIESMDAVFALGDRIKVGRPLNCRFGELGW